MTPPLTETELRAMRERKRRGVPTFVFEGMRRRVQLSVFDYSEGPMNERWPTTFRVRSLPLLDPRSRSYASGHPECNSPDFRKAWGIVERIVGCRVPIPESLEKYARAALSPAAPPAGEKEKERG
jgi:hypothetical protein